MDYQSYASNSIPRVPTRHSMSMISLSARYVCFYFQHSYKTPRDPDTSIFSVSGPQTVSVQSLQTTFTHIFF